MREEQFYAYTFDVYPEGKIVMEPASPNTLKLKMWDTVDQLHSDLAGQTYRIYSTHRVMDHTLYQTPLNNTGDKHIENARINSDESISRDDQGQYATSRKGRGEATESRKQSTTHRRSVTHRH